MKKTSFLMALACFGLLITGCNPATTSSESKPASTSGNASTSSKPSTSTPSSSSTSSVIPDPETYYEVEFGAANEALNDSGKWGKGKEYKWTFSVPKHYTKVVFAVGAQMSSSSHGDRSLYTNHEGASSSDSFESNAANDGTCRVVLKVNGVEKEVTHDTYTDAGLTSTEMNYFKMAEFAVNSGDVEVSLTTNAKTGYRLMLGEGARLYYKAADESATPTVEEIPDAHKVSFTTNHCKVLVYEGDDYATSPKEAQYAYSMDCDAEPQVYAKYAAADATTGKAEVKPQVNFKVQCDEGYEVDTSCFVLSGTEGNEWNNLKDISDGIYRITTIKADITATITAVASGTLKAGYVASFVTEHCSIKVYTAKDFVTEDTATPYMSRNKTKSGDEYPYAKGEVAQLSFEVVPEEGYEFVSGLKNGAEAESDDIEFIAPSGYNKIKRVASNRYNITKVSHDLTITIKCTEAEVVPPVTIDGTKVTKTVAELQAENSWEDTAAIGSFTIGQVDVTLTGDAGDTKYYANGSNLRIYINKNGGTGSVAFAAKDGYKIVAVKITFVWNKGTGTFPLESEAIGMVNETSKTYEIGNPGGSNEQMRISAFEIYYDVAA